MTFSESAFNITSIGAIAIQHWLDSMKKDEHLWHAFLDMCKSVGMFAMEEYRAVADVQPARQQLHRLMQLLISKYTHANITGLLRHTSLLCVKDVADAQAMREECKVEAAAAKRAADKASKEAAVAAKAVTAGKPTAGKATAGKATAHVNAPDAPVSRPWSL
jgi:hypothetical protein